MSRSMYWLSALAPAAESDPPRIVAASESGISARPCAAMTIVVTVVKMSRMTMRGLVSWR